MGALKIGSIDISHDRLVELAKLADQALPFYEWAERKFQTTLKTKDSLETCFKTESRQNLKVAISACYEAEEAEETPMLFDGVGRSYIHRKACFYFFAWLLRDAPQQRLAPLVTKVARELNIHPIVAEVEILSNLACEYRKSIQNFSWLAVREVIIDRLEGSRRSIKGHEREVVVRSAFAAAIQSFFKAKGNYGKYHRVELSKGQVKIGNETYDVCVELKNQRDQVVRRILAPVKTRETEGGGHAHLFTRDITQAINLVRETSPEDFVVVVIVAKNWSVRESSTVSKLVDHAVVFDLSPNEFKTFDEKNQSELNHFLLSVLSKNLDPKK